MRDEEGRMNEEEERSLVDNTSLMRIFNPIMLILLGIVLLFNHVLSITFQLRIHHISTA